jgi:hypothetical protein
VKVSKAYILSVISLSIILLSLTVSCKNSQKASQKSYIGLTAKIHEDIANGGAPSYAALRDWFDNKEDPSIPKPKKFADVSYELNSKTVDLMKKAGVLEGFVDYYERQIERIHLFQRNLDGSKRSELELQRLFDLESSEMRDIILALISTSYSPKTSDGLAILISNRKLRSYFDHTAKTFLDIIFQRDLNAIEENIGSEEKNFSRILMKQNVKNGKPTSEFILSLQKSCRELIGFVTALQGRVKNKCEGGSGAMSLGSTLNLDSGYAGLSSANGKLASLFGGVLSSGGPISVAANKGGAPSLSIFAGRDLTKGDPSIQGGTQSQVPNASGNEINGTVNPTLNPTPINTPNVEPNLQQDSSGMNGNMGGNSFEAILKSIFDSNFQSLFNGSGLGLSLENQSLLANDFTLSHNKKTPKPKFNCLDFGFRGIDLARCQRYFAIMPDLPVVNADAGTPRANA